MDGHRWMLGDILWISMDLEGYGFYWMSMDTPAVLCISMDVHHSPVYCNSM